MPCAANNITENEKKKIYHFNLSWKKMPNKTAIYLIISEGKKIHVTC